MRQLSLRRYAQTQCQRPGLSLRERYESQSALINIGRDVEEADNTDSRTGADEGAHHSQIIAGNELLLLHLVARIKGDRTLVDNQGCRRNDLPVLQNPLRRDPR